jgi:hypothetical protein
LNKLPGERILNIRDGIAMLNPLNFPFSKRKIRATDLNPLLFKGGRGRI